MDEEEDNEVGSPSPPYEGIITEEAEKQLESNVGEFEASQATNGDVGNVNDFFHKSSKKLKFEAFAELSSEKLCNFLARHFTVKLHKSLNSFYSLFRESFQVQGF